MVQLSNVSLRAAIQAVLERIEDYIDGQEAKRSMAEGGDVVDWDDLVKELKL